MQLFPKAVAPYVKAWVTLVGVIVAAVVTAVDDIPTWVTIVGAVATSIGVFMGRNRPAPQGGEIGPAPAPRHSDGADGSAH